MAKFLDLIKSGKIKAAYSIKQAAITDVNKNCQLINDLDVDTPNVRVFSMYEANANSSLETLKTASKDLDVLVLKVNPQMAADEAYKSDQKSERGHILKLCNAIEDYTQVLNDKGITYPPEVKPADNSGDLAALITQQDKLLSSLLDAQNKNQEAQNIYQDKLLNTLVSSNNDLVASNKINNDDLVKAQSNKTSSPKAIQPIFTSKGDDSDFGVYRDFIDRFNFFVAKCSNKAEKLQWLKSSVKGDASHLIKNLSLDEANYDIAIKRLADRYLNPDSISSEF